MKHTLVISDVHLCEAVHSDGPWMRWRQRPYFPDAEFVGLVDHLLVRLPPGEHAELVFNGDLFDFDAGRVIDGRAVFEDLPRTEPVARELIERILDDHPGYVAAVGRFLAAGHHVVFVSGNHDPQLGFDRVRRFIRERLALAAGHPRFADAVHFRAWFHHTAEGIHIEHGNQFDPYCSFRYPMLPLLPPERGRDRVIAPTVGSITFRLLGSRLGTMNPHFDDSWDMSFGDYLRHWSKHYLRTEHSLAWTFFAGSFRIVAQTFQGRDAGSADRFHRNVEAAARETRCDPDRVAEHARLFAPPADEALHKVIREFYVDRVVLGALSAGAIVAPLVARSRRTVSVALGAIFLMLGYELASPSRGLDDNYRRIAARARDIARIYGSRAVVFGHTHTPYGVWEEGVFYGNSGTWSPAMVDIESGAISAEHKPVLWLTAEDGALSGGLFRWDGTRLEPDPESISPVPVRRPREATPSVHPPLYTSPVGVD